MKSGDLRRFTANGPGWDVAAEDIFMVIDIVEVPGRADRTGVTFLVGGGLVTAGWSRWWVLENSEVISEAGWAPSVQ